MICYKDTYRILTLQKKRIIVVSLISMLLLLSSGKAENIVKTNPLMKGRASANSAFKEYERSVSMCAALLMDSNNGEIIYIYNRPAVIERHFTPGSIVKPWSALVLLQYKDELSFSKDITINCIGRHYPNDIKFSNADLKTFNLPSDNTGQKYFRCSLIDGHGTINLHSAITRSCNDFFLRAAAKSPENFFRRFDQNFAFKLNTGAILLKNEEKPIKNNYINKSAFCITASAIGEGGIIRCSPLKAAQIYAAIFSRGQIPVPFEKPIKPAITFGRLEFAPANIEFVYTALQDTVKTGTLKKLSAAEGPVKILAGKSGTATIYGERYRTHGWNILHVAYKSKKYVLVGFAERGSGAKEALKISSILLNNMPDIISEYEAEN